MGTLSVTGFRTFATLALAGIVLAACASQKGMVTSGPHPVWPAPPDEPRLIHVQSISRAEDLNIRKGFFTRLYEFIVGPSDLRLIRPMAVVVAQDGTIFVADPGSHGVHRFDIHHQQHDLIQQGDEQPLASPVGLAIDGNNNVYVTDSVLGKVFVIKPGSDFATPLPLSSPIQQPTGIASDPDGKRLYVSDTTGHQIRVIGPDGKQLAEFGHRGSDKGEFNFPTYLWRGKDGKIYVTDSLNFRIQIFDSDGNFTGQFGHHGDATGDMANPKGVTTDSFGHIYVTDSMHHALQIFNQDGELLLDIGNRGNGPGEFWLPAGAFMTGDNHLYIADSYNQRIQVFNYIGDKP